MKPIKIGLVLLTLGFGLILLQRAEAQPRVANSVFGNGGAMTSGSSFQLNSTIGQPAIGMMSNASTIHQAGFWYQSGGFVTSVEEALADRLPTEYKLAQNYPNPFNPRTSIRYDLPEESEVTLKIYSLLGEEVAILLNDRAAPGSYKVEWQPAHLASGVYLCRLTARSSTGDQTFSEVKKLIYVR
ncbi:MAG: T9SS type A sorting domain-containing protein [candidate division KSB1 bacterium]|nr:T9SS type A sorting domain-containing protein [candidate division KSB1 bacterium]MDZ7341166.1 T9SS type A sorting domain-containing protein [candidate division KSB1 bacterium]